MGEGEGRLGSQPPKRAAVALRNTSSVPARGPRIPVPLSSLSFEEPPRRRAARLETKRTHLLTQKHVCGVRYLTTLSASRAPRAAAAAACCCCVLLLLPCLECLSPFSPSRLAVSSLFLSIIMFLRFICVCIAADFRFFFFFLPPTFLRPPSSSRKESSASHAVPSRAHGSAGASDLANFAPTKKEEREGGKGGERAREKDNSRVAPARACPSFVNVIRAGKQRAG